VEDRDRDPMAAIRRAIIEAILGFGPSMSIHPVGRLIEGA